MSIDPAQRAVMATKSSSYTLLILLVVFFGLVVPHCMAEDVLLIDEHLYSGMSLTNGVYRLTMQDDCNLGYYENNIMLWSTATYRPSHNCRLTMQRDGDLVVKDQNGQIVWQSFTARGEGSYALVLQGNREVAIYGNPIWKIDRSGYGTPRVIITRNTTQQQTPAAAAHVAAISGASEPINRKIISVVATN